MIKIIFKLLRQADDLKTDTLTTNIHSIININRTAQIYLITYGITLALAGMVKKSKIK